MTDAARNPERRELLRNLIGVAILAVAFGVSTGWVTYQAFWKSGDVTVAERKRIIRFAHWQLEGDVVQALNEACEMYEQMRPDVQVQQIEIPERGYQQWVRTQLVGRTAPDLIEMWSPGAREWENLIVRYFVPITDRVDDPNPYNARPTAERIRGTIRDHERRTLLQVIEPWLQERPQAADGKALEVWIGELLRRLELRKLRHRLREVLEEPAPEGPGPLERRLAAALDRMPREEVLARVRAKLAELPEDRPEALDLEGLPWRDTFIDGLQGGWYDNLQDYYGMPLSVFTVRCYANAEVLRQAAGDLLVDSASGKVEPPRDLGTFFEICRRIRRIGLTPIAGSGYVANVFRGRYWDPATWGLLETLDLSGDGSASPGEILLAVETGRLDLRRDPHVEAGHKALFDISRFFDAGFMAATRDEAVLMFAQGNAAMIATGSWEAGNLYKQVEGMFDILVFDLPVPQEGQKYGEHIRYRLSEAGARAGFPLGLTRFSRHPDLAVDFMHFLTSQPMNEWLNLRFRWFPSVRGARTDPVLRAFEPEAEGVYRVLGMAVGSDTSLRYDQQYQGFISTAVPEAADYEAWLDKHYSKFIDTYAQTFGDKAFGDAERVLEEAYAAATQTEVQMAQVRARALRLGLKPETRRHWSALVLGQTRRIEGRAVDQFLLHEARAARRQGAGP